MDAAIPASLAPLLDRFHFDPERFEALRSRLRSTTALESLHRITSPLAPPSLDCAAALPEEGSAARAALTEEGSAAIARGELATVVLAGGMATRFGSVVKALASMELPEGPDWCFLDAKLADLARWGGAVPAALMTSFATHDAIAAWVAGRGLDVALAPQFISLRLTPDGGIFRGADGGPSLYATGHGDLPEALHAAGLVEAWRRRGVRTVVMSNVDNVGATVDPALFAMHRRAGGRVSVELVEKVAGDRGGLPVSVDGRLVLAEAFRLPPEFPQESFPLFNTNTLWIDLDALSLDAPWTWCVARKKVEGRDAIQFERLVGELTWWHPTRWMHVPRSGAASRFIPVKDLDELERSAGAISAVIGARLR
jgi:UTP--glucose-1-phosphate uridylyltransferase